MNQLNQQIENLKIESVSCTVCGDSKVIVEETPTGRLFKGHCQCQIPVYNLRVWQFIHRNIPDMLSSFISNDFNQKGELDNKQKELITQIGKRCWIHGKSGKGKSHLFLEKIRLGLKSEKLKFIRARYYHGEMFEKLFIDQYSDKYSREELENIGNLDLIYIDDIDKIGDMTSHKSYKLLNIFNNQIEKIPMIYISSNLSVKAMCDKIKDPTVSDPLYTRLVGNITPIELELK